MKATRNYAIADPAPTGKHGTDKYKLRPASPLTIIFEDLDLSFTDQEIATAQKIYNGGGRYPDVANILDRDETEALLLGIFLMREGLVK